MAEENDLLSFFNKKDKLKAAAPAKKPAQVKKEEVIASPPPEVKEPQKPTKAVQDLRALRYVLSIIFQHDPRTVPKSISSHYTLTAVITIDNTTL